MRLLKFLFRDNRQRGNFGGSSLPSHSQTLLNVIRTSLNQNHSVSIFSNWKHFTEKARLPDRYVRHFLAEGGGILQITRDSESRIEDVCLNPTTGINLQTQRTMSLYGIQ